MDNSCSADPDSGPGKEEHSKKQCDKSHNVADGKRRTTSACRPRGRPRCQQQILRGKNDARADLMQQSRVCNIVLKSLQMCMLRDNHQVLSRLISREENEATLKANKCKGLIAVLNVLKSEQIAENGQVYDSSFLPFDEAMELYYSYLGRESPFIKTDKDHFQYALLHESWGLCVYVIYVRTLQQKYIVLRPDEFGLELFLEMVCKCETLEISENRMDLDSDKVESMMNTIDSEWDRKVARVFLGASRSRSEINRLGIDSDNIKKETAEVCDYT